MHSPSRKRIRQACVPVCVRRRIRSVQLSLGTKGTNAAILVRLRSGRCTCRPRAGCAVSRRPRKHEAGFDCADESWRPCAGRARLRGRAVRRGARAGVGGPAPKQTTGRAGRAAPGRSCAARSCSWRSPSCRTLPGSRGYGWWREPGEPDLDPALALVRPSIRSGACVPVPQADNWAGPLREVVIPSKPTVDGQLAAPPTCGWGWRAVWRVDRRLPWERQRDTRRLTPCRVRRSFSALLHGAGHAGPTRRNPAAAPGRAPRAADRVVHRYPTPSKRQRAHQASPSPPIPG